MKTRYWWNRSFEELMTAFGDWLGANPTVTLVSNDWKYVEPSNETGYWYMLVVYRP